MVSFQCDGCSDVIKKPKLDQHHSRGCHASFTCIDCSQTFQTPADWKGHTSCISEAQKYQKTMYKPKPNDGGRDYQQLGSKGKFQRQGGQWTRPSRYQATGANGTPLGTPTRMSPVTVQPSVEEKNNSTAVPAATEATKSMEKTPPKPHKKRKAESAEGVVVEASQSDITGQEESGSKDKKKKDKKDRKKVRAEETVAIETNGVQTEGASLAQSAVAAESSDDKPKKSKKSKKDKPPKQPVAAESLDALDPPEPSLVANQTDIGQEKKKKKKKKKSDNVGDEAGINEDAVVSTDVSVPSTEKKSKKRKREAEGMLGLVEDAGEGKKKKKKKAAAS